MQLQTNRVHQGLPGQIIQWPWAWTLLSQSHLFVRNLPLQVRRTQLKLAEKGTTAPFTEQSSEVQAPLYLGPQVLVSGTCLHLFVLPSSASASLWVRLWMWWQKFPPAAPCWQIWQKNEKKILFLKIYRKSLRAHFYWPRWSDVSVPEWTAMRCAVPSNTSPGGRDGAQPPYSCPRTIIAMYPKVCGLDNRNLSSHSPEGHKSKVKVWAGMVPSRGSKETSVPWLSPGFWCSPLVTVSLHPLTPFLSFAPLCLHMAFL